MTKDEIRSAIESFPSWHYEIDLGGVKTPVRTPSHRNRHEQRRRLFFDPVVQLYGGSLEGKRVLDLGCNAGYWSLLASEQGADFVLGVDARKMHVDQANLVFRATEIEPDRFAFVEASVFDLDFAAYGEFDVVLCLGLLYHVSKPMELLERAATVNSDVVVIDTTVSLAPMRLLTFHRDYVEEPRAAADTTLVAHPSRGAVEAMLEQLGYAWVVPAHRFSDWSGCLDYRLGWRRAFIGAKRSALGAVASQRDSPLRVVGRTALWPIQESVQRGVVAARVARAKRRLRQARGSDVTAEKP